MSELRKQKQAAIEAVARHFSATWEGGEEPADAYVTIAAKRVAVEVVTIKRVGNRRGDAKPRLRFDRVALRLVGGLQAALHGSVPDGKTVLVTITAPIRLAAKTAAALEDQIRSHLAHRSAQREVKYRIHGNHVRVRFVEGGSRAAAEVIGFVHNPDSDPNGFLDRTQSLLERIHARGAKGRSLETRARSMARCRRRGRSVACRDVSVRPSPAIDRDRLQEDSGSAGWWTDRAPDLLRSSGSSRRRGFKLSVSVPREVLGRCSSERQPR